MKGKIILCEAGLADDEVSSVISGVIIAGPYMKDQPSLHALPTTLISTHDGSSIIIYMSSTRYEILHNSKIYIMACTNRW